MCVCINPPVIKHGLLENPPFRLQKQLTIRTTSAKKSAAPLHGDVPAMSMFPRRYPVFMSPSFWFFGIRMARA